MMFNLNSVLTFINHSLTGEALGGPRALESAFRRALTRKHQSLLTVLSPMYGSLWFIEYFPGADVMN